MTRNEGTLPSDRRVELRLLGGFTLTDGGRPVEVPVCSQRAVAFIALHDRPITRARVAASIWLDKTGSRASANLRSALWRLNRCGIHVVSASGAHLELAPGVTVDVREFARWADRLERDRLDDGDLDRPLPHGEFLEDWYDDWVVAERERMRQRYLHALESLSRHLVESGRYGRGIETALTAVVAEPLRESAHRAVIQAHLAEGNRTEARRQYETYRRLLLEELGVAPSARMRALVDALEDSLQPV